jgi:hypothetical protein
VDTELAVLRLLAKRERQEGKAAVRGYRPGVEGDILDIRADARAILAGLPFVADVRQTPARGELKPG